MNKDQLRNLIERILKNEDLYSESAVELLMLTAAVESKLGYYIKQIKGPALGIFQMEPATEQDIIVNYLCSHRRDLYNKLSYYRSGWEPVHKDLKVSEMEWNLAYQILMCRIHYLRVPKKLPKADDIEGLAAYWKKYYNTWKGKGTIEKAIKAYNKYCI